MSNVIKMADFREVQPTLSRYEQFCAARRRLIEAAASWAAEGACGDVMSAEIDSTANALRLVAELSIPSQSRAVVS